MKFYQVLIAILAFKSLDWLLIAADLEAENLIQDTIIVVLIWALFWGGLWQICRLALAGREEGKN